MNILHGSAVCITVSCGMWLIFAIQMEWKENTFIAVVVVLWYFNDTAPPPILTWCATSTDSQVLFQVYLNTKETDLKADQYATLTNFALAARDNGSNL